MDYQDRKNQNQNHLHAVNNSFQCFGQMRESVSEFAKMSVNQRSRALSSKQLRFEQS